MSDLATVLDQTAAFLKRYVVFASPEQADAVALWTGHTWLYDQFDTTPYLAVQSPGKRSGKSRLLECLRLVTRQAVPMAGASLAALFRIIDERHPTLLLDEADTIFNKRASDSTEDVRGLLNNGYRRGVPFLRVVGDGKKMRVESFDVYCPKAIASIHALPDTVQDRSVVIALKRRARTESVERFRFRTAELEAVPVREWWESIAEQLTLPESADVPEQLDDRAADSWEPLLALADAAGDTWPERARRAALALSGAPEVEDDAAPIRLLAGINQVFSDKAVDRIPTSELIEGLRADEEAPWDDWHGRGLKPEGLAYLLRPYGIRARQMKLAGVKVRGFDLEQFADAFSRYLPFPVNSPLTRYPAPSERESEREGTVVPGQTGVPGEKQNGSVAGDNGHLWHTCHGCHQPILDLSDAFLDGASSTFWHRDHWQQRQPAGSS
jgi:hypothetical protein